MNLFILIWRGKKLLAVVCLYLLELWFVFGMVISIGFHEDSRVAGQSRVGPWFDLSHSLLSTVQDCFGSVFIVFISY